jgi:prepilin-type N-terminal cleavage/methylation domain-containing protein
MKHGFTLIELLVYMAIMGFVIVVAGRVFSDSTSMRMRSQNMLKSAEEIGKVSDLIREDISQMGVKAWWDKDNSSTPVNVREEVYWALKAGDTSSYALVRKTDNFDSLAFYKAEFDDLGKFSGTRQIEWYVKEKKLYRKCKTIGVPSTADNAVCPAEVIIAENLEKFKFAPSKPGIDINTNTEDTLFPPPKVDNYTYTLKAKEEGGGGIQQGTAIVGDSEKNSPAKTINVKSFTACIKGNEDTKKNYHQVYLTPSGGDNTWKDCFPMALIKGETYSIQFEMPYVEKEADTASTQFLPGYDHIAIGFRKNDNPDDLSGMPNDVLFYPPQSREAESVKRYAEFSVQKDVPIACVAITFSFCSINDANNGNMRFRKFEVLRKTDRAFHFPRGNYGYDRTAAQGEDLLKEKKNVKAFELSMEIVNGGEKARTNANDAAGMIITTPNNGVFVKVSQ